MGEHAETRSQRALAGQASGGKAEHVKGVVVALDAAGEGFEGKGRYHGPDALQVVPGPAVSGFDKGVAAYKRGDYATALRELRPLAEQGNRQPSA